MREDFKSVEDLMSRATVLGKQLNEFNYDTWVHLRNREDFDRIYNLAPETYQSLERIYKDGREFASHLGYLLIEFEFVALYPTFKSWTDAVAEYLDEVPPKLRATIDSVRATMEHCETKPWSVGQMIELSERQLKIGEALFDWVRTATESALYRQEAGLPSRTTTELAEASRRGALRGAVLTGEALSVIAAIILAACWIRDPSASWEPWTVLAGIASAALEIARRELSA